MLKKVLLYSLPICMAFVIFSLAITAHAQVKNTDLVIELSPEHPAPKQNVTARISTFVIDLKKSYISWSVNGSVLAGGIGRDSFSFDMGTGPTEISVSVDTVDGQNVVKTISVTPADIDLLWEAYDSYAPPFYKGKTLVAKEGTYKVVAIPSVSSTSGKYNSNNLAYTWKKDYKVQQDSSGWGKRFYIYKNSYIDRSNQISVDVSDILGNVNTAKSINLQPTSAKIVFYAVDPTYGPNMANAMADGYEVPKKGVTILALPYFVNPNILSSDILSFAWKVSGADVYTTNPRNELGLVPESGKSGTSTVSLEVNNNSNLFPGVKKEMLVSF